MFSQNVILPLENLRLTVFASKPMHNEIVKPLPLILICCFKALLQQHVSKLRVTTSTIHQRNCPNLQTPLIETQVQFETYHHRSHNFH